VGSLISPALADDPLCPKPVRQSNGACIDWDGSGNVRTLTLHDRTEGDPVPKNTILTWTVTSLAYWSDPKVLLYSTLKDGLPTAVLSFSLIFGDRQHVATRIWGVFRDASGSPILINGQNAYFGNWPHYCGKSGVPPTGYATISQSMVDKTKYIDLIFYADGDGDGC
jgi:hypothetical protein